MSTQTKHSASRFSREVRDMVSQSGFVLEAASTNADIWRVNYDGKFLGFLSLASQCYRYTIRPALDVSENGYDIMLLRCQVEAAMAAAYKQQQTCHG